MNGKKLWTQCRNGLMLGWGKSQRLLYIDKERADNMSQKTDELQLLLGELLISSHNHIILLKSDLVKKFPEAFLKSELVKKYTQTETPLPKISLANNNNSGMSM